MFYDHRSGRTRLVLENGDTARFRHPEPCAISAYGVGWNEAGEAVNRCISDIIPRWAPVKVVDCHYYDPRKVHELDVHKFTIQWIDHEGIARLFLMNEHDLIL